VSTSDVLAQIIGGDLRRPSEGEDAPPPPTESEVMPEERDEPDEPVRRPLGPPPIAAMPAILAAAKQEAGPPLRIRKFEGEDGPAFWRWDCESCGEYGGGRHHVDAVSRAMRHCAEHPQHRSSLLPPTMCRQRDGFLPLHPMLFAVDDDLPPPPLSI
jgi:hypothetical protein